MSRVARSSDAPARGVELLLLRSRAPRVAARARRNAATTLARERALPGGGSWLGCILYCGHYPLAGTTVARFSKVIGQNNFDRSSNVLLHAQRTYSHVTILTSKRNHTNTTYMQVCTAVLQ